MKKFLEWLRNIHSTGTNDSAKRLYGAIGYISAIVYIGVWKHDFIDILLYTSAGLLGLETIFQVFKKKGIVPEPEQQEGESAVKQQPISLPEQQPDQKSDQSKETENPAELPG